MEVYVPDSNLTFTSAIVKENGSRSRFDEENMPSGPNKRLLKDRYHISTAQNKKLTFYMLCVVVIFLVFAVGSMKISLKIFIDGSKVGG